MPRNFSTQLEAVDSGIDASMRPRQMPRNFIGGAILWRRLAKCFNEAAADAAEF